MSKPQFVSGTVVGTGASINVSCGFVPDYVEVVSDTAGDELKWNSSLADGSAYKRIAAGTSTKITSLGISKYAGTASIAAGFTIGADATVNVNTVPMRWIAQRNI